LTEEDIEDPSMQRPHSCLIEEDIENGSFPSVQRLCTCSTEDIEDSPFPSVQRLQAHSMEESIEDSSFPSAQRPCTCSMEEDFEGSPFPSTQRPPTQLLSEDELEYSPHPVSQMAHGHSNLGELEYDMPPAAQRSCICSDQIDVPSSMQQPHTHPVKSMAPSTTWSKHSFHVFSPMIHAARSCTAVHSCEATCTTHVDPPGNIK